jgi:hypothetical protein
MCFNHNDTIINASGQLYSEEGGNFPGEEMAAQRGQDSDPLKGGLSTLLPPRELQAGEHQNMTYSTIIIVLKNLVI